MGTLKIHLFPSHIGQVLGLPSVVSLSSLHSASLQITLSGPEVAGTENRVTFSLPFHLDPSIIVKMHS